MKVRVTWTATWDDEARRIIAEVYGDEGEELASRETLKGLMQDLGEMGLDELIGHGRPSAMLGEEAVDDE